MAISPFQLLDDACDLGDLNVPSVSALLYIFMTFEGSVSSSLLVWSDSELKMWV